MVLLLKDVPGYVMILKTVLVEDEVLILQEMERLVSCYPDFIEIVGKASNGMEAIKIIDTLKPELVFLDIRIPGFTGFEVLEQVTHIPMVIFCTSYDSYALAWNID